MMFLVRVDKHGEFIFVCKDLISRTSAFFRSISCDNSWRPGLTIPVDLPGVDAESFRVYTHWVNTGKLVIEPCRCKRFHEFHEQKSFIEAFILGDILDDLRYRQHVIDVIIARLPSWTEFLPGDLVSRIWAATQSGSPLRTFALRWMLVKHPGSFTLKVENQALPKEFLAEALSFMFERSAPETDEQCVDSLRQLLLTGSDGHHHQNES